VPSGRLARLARFGGLAGGLAGNVAVGAVRRLAEGGRPELGDLLLTPANVARVTRELAHLRGAAMKMGQLLSMDAGELLPPELAGIMARLRADAEAMPPKQLKAALDRAWGPGWLARFESFDVRPLAAASIGQVHRARTRDGRDLAIKVQFPGVRRSIDSDVDNVAALIRLSGLAPQGLDLAPLLTEAKRQLREEADYEREGAWLRRFGALVEGSPVFVAPGLHADLTTQDVLAMDYLPGVAVESLSAAPQDQRDCLAEHLLDWTLRELLDFGAMQTDPNFANYRFDAASGRIILLDFGAAREIPRGVSDGYRRLLAACLADDATAINAELIGLGLLEREGLARHHAAIAGMIAQALEPLRRGGPYDFGDRTLARRLRDEGLALASDRAFWTAPPPDVLLVQRKLAGMYLLAARLGARVDVRALLERRLAG
jgi:predicted unusual protein kinase regulating ubiquinone biosynthesis (AarF/ABC1/UbiB family)